MCRRERTASWGRTTTLAALLASQALVPGVLAVEADAIAAGKAIAFDREKGNCLACHAIADGESPGTIGPPLVDMKRRFPDEAALRELIWDPTRRNPETSMPPFGKHRIVTEEELDKIAAFIWSL